MVELVEHRLVLDEPALVVDVLDAVAVGRDEQVQVEAVGVLGTFAQVL